MSFFIWLNWFHTHNYEVSCLQSIILIYNYLNLIILIYILLCVFLCLEEKKKKKFDLHNFSIARYFWPYYINTLHLILDTEVRWVGSTVYNLHDWKLLHLYEHNAPLCTNASSRYRLSPPQERPHLYVICTKVQRPKTEQMATPFCLCNKAKSSSPIFQNSVSHFFNPHSVSCFPVNSSM